MSAFTNSKGKRTALWLLFLVAVLIAFAFDPTSGRYSLPGAAVIALLVLVVRYHCRTRARRNAERDISRLDAELGRARNRTTETYGGLMYHQDKFRLAISRVVIVLDKLREKSSYLQYGSTPATSADWELLSEAAQGTIKELQDAAYWAKQGVNVAPGLLAHDWKCQYAIEVPVAPLPPSTDGLTPRNVPGEWYWGVDPRHVSRTPYEHEAEAPRRRRVVTLAQAAREVLMLSHYRQKSRKTRSKPNEPAKVLRFPSRKRERSSDSSD